MGKKNYKPQISTEKNIERVSSLLLPYILDGRSVKGAYELAGLKEPSLTTVYQWIKTGRCDRYGLTAELVKEQRISLDEERMSKRKTRGGEIVPIVYVCYEREFDKTISSALHIAYNSSRPVKAIVLPLDDIGERHIRELEKGLKDADERCETEILQRASWDDARYLIPARYIDSLPDKFVYVDPGVKVVRDIAEIYNIPLYGGCIGLFRKPRKVKDLKRRVAGIAVYDGARIKKGGEVKIKYLQEQGKEKIIRERVYGT